MQVSDFGLAANVRNTGSVQSSKTGIGTLNWSAPEVFARHYKQRPESDIWSLGMIIYEVLARQVPYDGLTVPQLTMALHMDKELPDVALIEEGASEGLRKLLEACCQFDPDKRPTAQVVVRDIAAIQKATKQTRKAVPRSMQHHDEVLRLLAEFAKLKEDQQRLAQEVTGLAAAMDDLRQDLHSDLAKCATTSDVVAMLNRRDAQLKDFIAKVTTALPRPSRIEVSRRLLGTRKTLTLVFVCPATGFEFEVQSSSWSLWLKFAISLVQTGYTLLKGDLVDAAGNGMDLVGKAYAAYHEGKADEASFESLMRAPLLLSKEQDQLVEGLRTKKFFERFEYDAQRGQWVKWGSAQDARGGGGGGGGGGRDGGGAAEETRGPSRLLVEDPNSVVKEGLFKTKGALYGWNSYAYVLRFGALEWGANGGDGQFEKTGALLLDRFVNATQAPNLLVRVTESPSSSSSRGKSLKLYFDDAAGQRSFAEEVKRVVAAHGRLHKERSLGDMIAAATASDAREAFVAAVRVSDQLGAEGAFFDDSLAGETERCRERIATIARDQRAWVDDQAAKLEAAIAACELASITSLLRTAQEGVSMHGDRVSLEASHSNLLGRAQERVDRLRAEEALRRSLASALPSSDRRSLERAVQDADRLSRAGTFIDASLAGKVAEARRRIDELLAEEERRRLEEAERQRRQREEAERQRRQAAAAAAAASKPKLSAAEQKKQNEALYFAAEKGEMGKLEAAIAAGAEVDWHNPNRVSELSELE